MPLLQRLCMAAAAVFVAPVLCGVAAISEGEQAGTGHVRLAVGGKPALFYLPLTVTNVSGYFRDQGLEVEIADFPGGARALQALIGGSADVVAGSFDHTIQMQAKNQPIVGWCCSANSRATCSRCWRARRRATARRKISKA